ncbi:MAG: hypothetical protein ACOY3Y_03590 [Acidobacteriota bacterium]
MSDKTFNRIVIVLAAAALVATIGSIVLGAGTPRPILERQPGVMIIAAEHPQAQEARREIIDVLLARGCLALVDVRYLPNGAIQPRIVIEPVPVVRATEAEVPSP